MRLYRPFSTDHFLAALPATTPRGRRPRAHQGAGRDRGTALSRRGRHAGPGGRRRPARSHAARDRRPLRTVLEGFHARHGEGGIRRIDKPAPRNSFTVGITDDVSGTSLDVDPTFMIEPDEVVRAVFYGLGSDGTVGANKNSVKILAEDRGPLCPGLFRLRFAQVRRPDRVPSSLRAAPDPCALSDLAASFVACHQFGFLDRVDVLRLAAPGATFLLNCPYEPDEAWDHLPRSVQQEIIDKRLRLFVIDASQVARDTGLGSRINTVLQTCFFAISGVLPREEAVQRIKHMIEKTYGKQGRRASSRKTSQPLTILWRICARSRYHKRRRAISSGRRSCRRRRRISCNRLPPRSWPGEATTCPSARCPSMAHFPSGTAAWEKRNIADEVPIWETDLCIQCGQCALACPHSVIRAQFYDGARLDDPMHPRRPPSSPRRSMRAAIPTVRFTLQFYVEDCTGVRHLRRGLPGAQPARCPATKAINMAPKAPVLEAERENIAFFESLPINDRALVDFANVRGIQFLEPLFEFSGACAGCGETPYLRLLSQLFGDRLQIANATGCSSIYGGNLPVTPWTANREGRGPAWSNSLFEDNAEFGLGFRLAADMHGALAARLLRDLAPKLGEPLAEAILAAPQIRESEILAQRGRVAELKRRLTEMGDDPRALDLLSVLDHLIRRSIWLVGGDGWAYDIGYGGLDHVLASGRDVNVLVLDTEVYSNTGGQASKATPLGAVAKFAAAGKRVARKDLALQAIAYGNVYVAQVAMGANPQQTLAGFSRGRGLAGTIADPRLQPLHRARFRSALRDAPAGSGDRLRLLAAVSLQPGDAQCRRSAIPARFATPDDPAEGLRLQRAALSQPGQHSAARGRRVACPRADRGKRKIRAIRGARQPRWQPVPPRRRRHRRSERLRKEHGSRHTLSRPCAAQPDHRVGFAAHGRCRRHSTDGRFRRWRCGPAIPVRGANPARGAIGL